MAQRQSDEINKFAEKQSYITPNPFGFKRNYPHEKWHKPLPRPGQVHVVSNTDERNQETILL